MASNTVEQLRKKRSWTRKVLAEKVDMSVSLLTKIERGERRIPDDRARKFAEVFGVTAGEVIEGLEEVQRVPLIDVSQLPAIAYGAEKPDHAQTLIVQTERKNLVGVKYDGDFGVETKVGKVTLPQATVVLADPDDREGVGTFFATRGAKIAIVTHDELTTKTKPLAKITHFITRLET